VPAGKDTTLLIPLDVNFLSAGTRSGAGDQDRHRRGQDRLDPERSGRHAAVQGRKNRGISAAAYGQLTVLAESFWSGVMRQCDACSYA
jgi:hypothetical protein